MLSRKLLGLVFHGLYFLPDKVMIFNGVYIMVWCGLVMVFEAYILTCFNKVCLTGVPILGGGGGVTSFLSAT